jgi:large subunit ribosomal protein L29
MKTDDLRKLSDSELQKELDNLLREQFNMRMQRGSGQNVASHLIHNARKNIARIKTMLTEKREKGE